MAKYTLIVSFLCALLWSIFDITLCDCKVAEIDVQPDFNASRFQGTWREVAWLIDESVAEEDYLRNYEEKYVLQSDGSLAYDFWGRDTSPETKCFYSEDSLLATGVTGKYTVKSNSKPNWIIETDYDSYSVQYGCRETDLVGGFCTADTASVQSRSRRLTPEQWQKVDLVLERLCLTRDMFMETKQDSACPAPNVNSASFSVSRYGTALFTALAVAMYIVLESPSV